jgi:hypothetical protein
MPEGKARSSRNAYRGAERKRVRELSKVLNRVIRALASRESESGRTEALNDLRWLGAPGRWREHYVIVFRITLSS